MPQGRKILGSPKTPSPPSSVAAALRSRVPTGANASAPLNDTRRQLVQRITQAPPRRLTNPRPYWPVFRLRLEPLTLEPLTLEPFTLEPLTLAAQAFGCLLLALAVFALPFAGPAFLGSAAFGPARDSAVPVVSTSWVGVGKAGGGSDRSCAGASLWKALPASRRPAPGGSVATTPSGGPASFQASAASSSSLSLSPSSPAMIASAIRPAFWRTAASILLATSGFSLRNCLAFSRP